MRPARTQHADGRPRCPPNRGDGPYRSTGSPSRTQPSVNVMLTDMQGARTAADADGTGIFGSRLAPGRYVAAVDGASETFDVTEGGETHVRLVLRTR